MGKRSIELELLVEIGKNTLLALPPVRHVHERRKLAAGMVPESLSTRYAKGRFELHSAAVAAVRPVAGADVLEVGPGGNLASLALFRRAGARQITAIDIDPWNRHSDTYQELGIAEEAADAAYHCPVSVDAMPFRDDSFDIVYSHACFEHFADPARAAAEIARVLRPGGVTSHLIDLRDHTRHAHDDPLHFLRYRDWQWHLATSNRKGHPNRWRASELTTAFRRAGLEVVRAEPTATVAVDPQQRSALAPRFRDKPLEDLQTIGLHLVARKP